MSKIEKIVAVAPPVRARRALELFQDNRFKPRVVRNRRIYTRKGRQGCRGHHGL